MKSPGHRQAMPVHYRLLVYRMVLAQSSQSWECTLPMVDPSTPPPPSKTGHTLNRLLRGGGGVTRARSTTVRRILVQYSGSASSPYMATWSAGEGARRFNLLGRFS